MSSQSNSTAGAGADSGLYQLPGHLVRRLNQINAGIFHDILSEDNTTPVQFGLLYRLTEVDGLDQITLSSQLGINRTTMGDVTRRLAEKGLVSRHDSPSDGRVKLLSITPKGRALVKKILPKVARVQERLLGPLTDAEAAQFIKLVKKIIDANNEFSRSPISAG